MKLCHNNGNSILGFSLYSLVERKWKKRKYSWHWTFQYIFSICLKTFLYLCETFIPLSEPKHVLVISFYHIYEESIEIHLPNVPRWWIKWMFELFLANRCQLPMIQFFFWIKSIFFTMSINSYQINNSLKQKKMIGNPRKLIKKKN